MKNRIAIITLLTLIFGTTQLYSAQAVEQPVRGYRCEATGYIEGYKGQLYQKKFVYRNSNLEDAKTGVISYCQHSAFECVIARCVLEICTDDC